MVQKQVKMNVREWPWFKGKKQAGSVFDCHKEGVLKGKKQKQWIKILTTLVLASFTV